MQKNKMYYSVWEMFSLSYGNRRLMFYSSNVANFLNKRFSVNLSYSGSSSSRSPIESLWAKMPHLIFMVLSFPICKTGMIFLLQNQRNMMTGPITDMNSGSSLIYQKIYMELLSMLKAWMPIWYWSWAFSPPSPTKAHTHVLSWTCRECSRSLSRKEPVPVWVPVWWPGRHWVIWYSQYLAGILTRHLTNKKYVLCE